MREPPLNLSADALAAAVRTHYGLAVTTVSFLPLGHDSSAWVYRVRAEDGTAYFLKVRHGVTNAAGLLAPRYLHAHGIAPVVAPLPDVRGALWVRMASYALILYPFIGGATGMAQGLSEAQWIAYGAILRRVHSTEIVPELARALRRETFVPAGAATVRTVEGDIGARRWADPLARELAAVWRERRAVIRTLVSRAEELGAQLARMDPPCVLCHADIHTDNVLLGADGRVWIVDWDETVLAPKERDLMFAVGGGISRALVGEREEALFLRGYGATSLDPRALSYYRYAWAVNDIGAFAAEVVGRPDLGAVSKQAALDIFKRLFQPGEIVALALASGGGGA